MRRSDRRLACPLSSARVPADSFRLNSCGEYRKVSEMNKYGAQAMRHWQQTDPQRFQAIKDPQEFFTTLGAEVEQEIQTLAAAIAGPDRVGESYLEKAGRLNMARFNAESDILRERVLIPGPDDEPEQPATGPMADFIGLENRLNQMSDEELEALDISTLDSTFTPGWGEQQLPPSGARARARANLDALRILIALERRDAPASEQELQVLARWSGWGACPDVFDEDKPDWQAERAELRELLAERDRRADQPTPSMDAAYNAARRTTINAHYTHPQLAQAIWDMAGALGFRGGNALEPGCGLGTFIGLAPNTAAMTGVELDETTAAIAHQLYPQQRIVARSFADPTRARDASFDMAIGNVPFADVALHDPRHNPAGHTIHNHFIIKSLALTKPGGLVMLLTSRYTLDARNPAARRDMSELGDLLAAVRLPTGAHRRMAGTEALTDLLVFRRRQPGAAPGTSTSWLRTREIDVSGTSQRVNEHFVEHPDHVLGELTVGHGMYGAQTLGVNGTVDAAVIARHLEAIATELRDPPAAATGEGPQQHPAAAVSDVSPAPAVILAPEGLWDGHLLVLADGSSFAEVQDGQQVAREVPRTIRGELRHLIGLRDSARQLLELEAATIQDTPQITGLREHLRTYYEQYLSRYGPLNRAEVRRRGSDPETGEDLYSRVIPKAAKTHPRRPVRSARAVPRAVRPGDRTRAPRRDPPRAADHPARPGQRRRDTIRGARRLPRHARDRQPRPNRRPARNRHGNSSRGARRPRLRRPRHRRAGPGGAVPLRERARQARPGARRGRDPPGARGERHGPRGGGAAPARR